MKLQAATKLILTLGALLLNQVSLKAQTWTTVDDLSPGSGNAIVADAEGNIYAAGSVTDGQGIGHAVVMKSTDTGAAGATWLPVEDFNYLPGLDSSFGTMGVDGAGGVYAAGIGFTVNTSTVQSGYWIVRRSTDHGMTWATVDRFVLPGSTHNIAGAQCFAKDSAANIYIVGYSIVTNGKGSSQTPHWIVRKSADGGNSWFTVDDFLYTTDGSGLLAKGVVCTPSGVFVVGYGYMSYSINKVRGQAVHWLVRRSTNAGTNWTTVDDYQYLGNPTNSAAAKGGVAADAAGNLYVLGTGRVSSGPVHWLARKSIDGGATWSLVDDYLYQGNTASPNAVGLDAYGNVYGVGTGANHWLVRGSAPSGTAWITVDDFQYSANQGAVGFGFGASPAGNVFTIGVGSGHWVVREATP